MSYAELFDKDVIQRQFNNDRLLQILLDDRTYKLKRTKNVLPKNEIILEENQMHDKLYFVESGICSGSKEKQLIYFFGPHEMLGMNSILHNEASILTVIAMTEVVVWEFSKQEVMMKLMYMQEGIFYLYQDIRAKNEDLLYKIKLQTEPAETRIIKSLMEIGRLYGEEDQNNIKLQKEFTRKIIANYSNVTVTTVYIICKQFVEAGLLAPSLQICINKSALKEIINII